MKRFIAVLNDGSFINISASRMELTEDIITVYDGNELVAYLDTSAVIAAHIRKE